LKLDDDDEAFARVGVHIGNREHTYVGVDGIPRRVLPSP
jgi:hypothetical protein